MKIRRYIYLTLYLILAALCHQDAFAQSEFAPIGASWYHLGYDGDVVYQSFASNDTVVMGQKCRAINQNLFISKKEITYAAMYKKTRSLYLYGNADSTLIYNEHFNRFTPLYVFIVSAGDTVRLNMIGPSGCTFPYPIDTNKVSLSYVVDSVKNVLYGTELLKTVYTRSI